MDIKNKVNILLNILSVLCELAERDATFFLPQKGNEIDCEKVEFTECYNCDQPPVNK